LDYIFIDYENIAPRAIPDHSDIKMVFIFAGEKQKDVSFEVAESMQKLGSRAKLVRMVGTGKNALDFHIAFYIGKYSEIDPKGSFKIVSKDKGFDPLAKHLIAGKINCSRIESLAVKKMTKLGLQELIAELRANLKGLSEKARPKKSAKLKAYIKNRTHEEDAIVESIFEALVSEEQIKEVGGKILYTGSQATK